MRSGRRGLRPRRRGLDLQIEPGAASRKLRTHNSQVEPHEIEVVISEKSLFFRHACGQTKPKLFAVRLFSGLATRLSVQFIPFRGVTPNRRLETSRLKRGGNHERHKKHGGAHQLVRQNGGRTPPFAYRSRSRLPRVAHQLASAYNSSFGVRTGFYEGLRPPRR